MTPAGPAPGPEAGATSPALDRLCARIDALASDTASPVLIALDGRSAVGKSTLARRVGARTGALVVDGDDFSRGGDDADWDARGPAEKVELVIDWRRQRALLIALARGGDGTLAAVRLGR